MNDEFCMFWIFFILKNIESNFHELYFTKVESVMYQNKNVYTRLRTLMPDPAFK